MSIVARFKAIFQSQANGLAELWEDPRVSLDYSLARLEENRRALGHSLIKVSAARQRLEAQRDQLADGLSRYDQQATAAINAGRDDLARTALESKMSAQERLQDLENNVARLAQQENNLKETQQNLDRKINLHRAKNEELKSIYDSSQAQLRVRESLSGISADLADAGNTIRRIEARIQEMQSRADAIDRLIATGVLPDVLDPEDDDVDRQLNRLRREQVVEEELRRLKAEAADAQP
jgi:phage shock protein A